MTSGHDIRKDAERNPGQRRSVTFDGFNAGRGIAAIFVMLFHSGLGGQESSGFLAVDFFFMLSGFVIAHAYDERFRTGLSAWRFAAIRLQRFYPAFLISFVFSTLVAIGVVLKGQSYSLPEAIRSLVSMLLFIPSAYNVASQGNLYPFNGPVWSLAVEIIINVAYAFLFRFTKTKALAVVSVFGLTLISISLSTGIGMEGPHWHGWWVGYARGLWSFPIGVLACRKSWLLPKISPYMAMTLLATTLAFRPSSWESVYDILAITAVFPMIVVSLRNPVTRGQSFCLFLGRTSYPLYVIHFPLFMGVVALARTFAYSPSLLTALAAFILVSVCWQIDAVDEKWRHRRSQRTSMEQHPGRFEGGKEKNRFTLS